MIIELIDTLWNVNSNAVMQDCHCHLELIDTLWNVNVIGQGVVRIL